MSTNKGNEKKQDRLTEKAREIWLAGLGVFSTIEEEGEKLFNQFLEKGKELESKGESFEKKAREKVDSFSKYVEEQTDVITKEVTNRLNEWLPGMMEEKVQAVMDKLGISSQNEVKTLSDKVDKLTAAVEELAKKLESTDQ